MTPMTTVAEIESITACDLRVEALAALRRGETVEYDRRRYGGCDSINVETLHLPATGRAGQVVNATAVWGDYDESGERLTDEGGEVYGLDGAVIDRACKAGVLR